MIVKIADNKYVLEAALPIEEKLEAVNHLLQTTLEFHDETMTIEEYFTHTWEKPHTIIAMDLIGYYLTKENEDLSTLSRKRVREMSLGSERHTTFGAMGMDQLIKHGIIDIET